MMKMVASHQPNFLPWIGFWNKLAYSDLFVLSAGVQYSKSDVVNRVELNGSWLTLPLKKESIHGAIKDLRFHEDGLKKVIKTIDLAFPKRRYSRRYVIDAVLDTMRTAMSDSLLALNVRLILQLKWMLKIDTEIVVDLQPPDPRMTKTERLFDRVGRHVRAGEFAYMAGTGAKDYLVPSEIPEGVDVFVQKMSPDCPKDTILKMMVEQLYPGIVIMNTSKWSKLNGKVTHPV